MSNLKTTLALSALVFGSACSQEFIIDQKAKSPQDYSLDSDGVEVLNVDGVHLILSQSEASLDVLNIDVLLGEDVDELAIIADIPTGGWNTFENYQGELPISIEDLVNDLSASGEGELNILSISVNDDIINSIEYALDSGADVVFISVDDSSQQIVDTIFETYE